MECLDVIRFGNVTIGHVCIGFHRWKSKGSLYLSDVRIVFIADRASGGGKSVDTPCLWRTLCDLGDILQDLFWMCYCSGKYY